MGNNSQDTGKSGKQISQEYIETLKNYLDTLRANGTGLPSRNGKISTSAIALAAGIDRQSLYKNPHCRALLEAAAGEMELCGIGTHKPTSSMDDGKDQRIQTLEAQIATLTAEVYGLRAKLAQYGHIEAHMVTTGRRVIP
ncbi:MAG: hypothetical protein H6Q00_400 [Holophagaceae bacterium]|nr:hypothetical protein [Holophagaceae bacterium]